MAMTAAEKQKSYRDRQRQKTTALLGNVTENKKQTAIDENINQSDNKSIDDCLVTLPKLTHDRNGIDGRKF